MGVSLHDKVAVITGGASGIGRATALAMTEAGARVAIADVAPAAGARLVEIITAQGGEAMYVDTDVTRASAVDALFDAVLARWGRIDCAFNNAGVSDEPLFTIDATEENFDRVSAVNLKGVWLCMRRELKEMVRAGGGSIVNTASGMSRRDRHADGRGGHAERRQGPRHDARQAPAGSFRRTR